MNSTSVVGRSLRWSQGLRHLEALGEALRRACERVPHCPMDAARFRHDLQSIPLDDLHAFVRRHAGDDMAKRIARALDRLVEDYQAVEGRAHAATPSSVGNAGRKCPANSAPLAPRPPRRRRFSPVLSSNSPCWRFGTVSHTQQQRRAYCAAKGWLYWDGTRWTSDDGRRPLREAAITARSIYGEAERVVEGCRQWLREGQRAGLAQERQAGPLGFRDARMYAQLLRTSHGSRAGSGKQTRSLVVGECTSHHPPVCFLVLRFEHTTDERIQADPAGLDQPPRELPQAFKLV